MPDLSRVRDVWKNLGPKGQLGLVGSGLLVLVTFFFLFQMASKPSYSTLLSGLDPATTGQATKALDSAGVSYRIGNGGTLLEVKQGQESQAQIALAAKGVSSSGHEGLSSLSKSSFGQTDFQQKVAYQNALEGQIANTIEQIQGVGGAQVQLVLPEDSLFTNEGTKATAAVLLQGGSALDPGTIRGVAHLVSSSVKQLNAGDVTITDETGALLWPTDGATGALGSTTKIEAEQRYDAQLSSQINALLAQTLGPGKAQARVKSDLNLDQGTIDSVTYAKKGTPLSVTTDNEGLKATGGSGASPAGVASNVVPSYTQGAGGSSNSNYNHVKSTTDFGVSKTVESKVIAPGSVNRLDVALMVDKSVPAAQVAALQKSVAALAGIQPRRGDTLAVSQLAFAAQPTTAAAPKAGLPIPPAFAPLLKWLGIVLALGFFGLLVRRNLRKREREGVAVEPTWLREIEQTVPLAALDSGMAHNRLPDPHAARRESIRSEFEELVKTQPEQVAMQVGQWIKEN